MLKLLDIRIEYNNKGLQAITLEPLYNRE